MHSSNFPYSEPDYDHRLDKTINQPEKNKNMNTETKGLFSKGDLDKIPPDFFGSEIKFANLKMKFLNHIEEEIKYLEKCIVTTNKGGFSTHLNDGMNQQITKLKELHYDIVTNSK